MRFLAKPTSSAAAGMSYKLKGDNSKLRTVLVAEQFGYCAYTERRFRPDDSIAIEHFDPQLKDSDDCRNWYAALQRANQLKRRTQAKFAGASFFGSRFFHDRNQLELRIKYCPDDHVYYTDDPNDSEATQLIGFLSANRHETVRCRKEHVGRLKELFSAASWGPKMQLEYLLRHPVELDFPTALAAVLGFELASVIAATSPSASATTTPQADP